MKRFILSLILTLLLAVPACAELGAPIVVGSTDQTTYIRIIDSTDGTPETGVTSATSGLDLEYIRTGGAPVDLTESDLDETNSAHSDGGMKHVGGGRYRVDLPDAAFASGAATVTVQGTVTGMVVIPTTHPLWDFSPHVAVQSVNAIQFSGSATAADNAEVVFDTDFTANYDATADKWNTSVTHWDGDAVPTSDTAGYPKVTIKDGTGTGEIDTSSGKVALTTAEHALIGRAAHRIHRSTVATPSTGVEFTIADAMTYGGTVPAMVCVVTDGDDGAQDWAHVVEIDGHLIELHETGITGFTPDTGDVVELYFVSPRLNEIRSIVQSTGVTLKTNAITSTTVQDGALTEPKFGANALSARVGAADLASENAAAVAANASVSAGLTRIGLALPPAAPGADGGLPTVDGDNRIEGLDELPGEVWENAERELTAIPEVQLSTEGRHELLNTGRGEYEWTEGSLFYRIDVDRMTDIMVPELAEATIIAGVVEGLGDAAETLEAILDGVEERIAGEDSLLYALDAKVGTSVGEATLFETAEAAEAPDLSEVTDALTALDTKFGEPTGADFATDWQAIVATLGTPAGASLAADIFTKASQASLDAAATDAGTAATQSTAAASSAATAASQATTAATQATTAASQATTAATQSTTAAAQATTAATQSTNAASDAAGANSKAADIQGRLPDALVDGNLKAQMRDATQAALAKFVTTDTGEETPAEGSVASFGGMGVATINKQDVADALLLAPDGSPEEGSAMEKLLAVLARTDVATSTRAAPEDVEIEVNPTVEIVGGGPYQNDIPGEAFIAKLSRRHDGTSVISNPNTCRIRAGETQRFGVDCSSLLRNGMHLAAITEPTATGDDDLSVSTETHFVNREGAFVDITADASAAVGDAATVEYFVTPQVGNATKVSIPVRVIQ